MGNNAIIIDFKRFTQLFQYSIVILLLSGCSLAIEGKDNTIHHLIIGLGIVSIKETPSPSVVVTDSKAIGINISDRPGLKLGIGYSSSTVVTIPNNANNVHAEISGKPGGPLVIDVPKASLEINKPENGGQNDGKLK
jgi:hypothetical protein